MSKIRAKLIAKTEIIDNKLINELKTTSSEELIMYCARVSNPENQNSGNSNLLDYCARHGHWSIFEMANMVIEVETTRAISAQILRHRSFNFQEFCMSGDSDIYFDLPNADKNGKMSLNKMKLKDLYLKWSEGTLPIEYSRSEKDYRISSKQQIKNMYIRVYNEKTNILEHSHIKDVFKTGLKDVFEIELENGKKIKSTKEHKILTQNGFQSLEVAFGLQLINNIAVIEKNGLIGTNGQPQSEKSKDNNLTVEWSKIKKVKYIGKEMTYDLEVDHESHNYVANGIIVHNSQRYKEVTAFDDTFEIYDARRQDLKNRQNSINNMSEDDRLWFETAQLDVQELAVEKYQEALDKGIAKEQARFLLPLNVKTKIYINGNIRSWIHYLNIRTGMETQKEHRDIALQIKEIFKREFPNIAKALNY